MQDKWEEIRDIYLRIGEKNKMERYLVIKKTPTTAAPTSRWWILGICRIWGKWSVEEGDDFGSWKGRDMGESVKEWSEIKGGGGLKWWIFLKNPARSGRVSFIKDATIPRRRSFSVVTVRRWFCRVCPSLKITERCTWHDRCIRRSIAAAMVRRCICQWLLQSNFLYNFLVMCLQI